MTKKRLEQYLKDQTDVARLSKVVSRKVRDTVRGSMNEHPYTEVDVTVGGLDEKLVRRYRQKKRRVAAERQAIVAFVDGLEDLYMADLIKKRYLEQKTWVDIWEAHNRVGTVESYRMTVGRFLSK